MTLVVPAAVWTVAEPWSWYTLLRSWCATGANPATFTFIHGSGGWHAAATSTSTSPIATAAPARTPCCNRIDRPPANRLSNLPRSEAAEGAAVGQELGAVDVARGVGGKEDAGADQIVRCPDPAHRVGRAGRRLHVGGPRRADVGVEGAREDRVGPDLRRPRAGQAERERVERGLGHGIGQVEGLRPERAGSRDVDDRPAVAVGHPGPEADPQAERPAGVD